MKRKLKIIKQYKNKRKTLIYDLSNCDDCKLYEAMVILNYYITTRGMDLDFWEPIVKVKLNGRRCGLEEAHCYLSKLYNNRMNKTRIHKRGKDIIK